MLGRREVYEWTGATLARTRAGAGGRMLSARERTGAGLAIERTVTLGGGSAIGSPRVRACGILLDELGEVVT